MRPANAIDFWRGYALISIFVNHIPGNFFERFQYRNLTLSDSAELFVFLAGWAMRLSIENPKRPMSNSAVVYKLWGRAFTIYVAQTFITEIAIFILAAASIWLDAPFLLDWHNVGAVFHQPVEAHIGLVLLTHQLGYFNILPLYVVLMLAAPAVALLYRALPMAVLPLSVGLYVATLILGWNLPSWPVEGTWFFSPFAWQLIYVLGFLIAGKRTDLGAFGRRHLRLFQMIALPIVLVGLVIASTRFWDWINLPSLGLPFKVFDKTFMSPDRLASVLALVALGGGIFTTIDAWLPGLTRFLSMLGRNGLHVFCAGSLLSLCGQIVRFMYGGTLAIDAIMIVIGVSIMAATAWVLEWRSRTKAQAASAPAAPAAQPVAVVSSSQPSPLLSGSAAAQVPAVPPVAQNAPVPTTPKPVPPPAGAAATSAQAPSPPSLSPSCEAPATDIAAPAPLPNVARALAEHKTLEILAVGSAATETLGIDSGVKSYPVQIEDLLKAALNGVDVDIINRGTGGEVAQTSSDRIHSEVGVTKPDLVLWQLGTNDALARVDPEQFTEIVKSTIEWLKQQDIDVVLVGLQYTSRFARDESYFAIKHALDRIAKDEGILYIKRYDAMKFIAQTRAKVHLMTSDNYHLSALGTQCMAEHVAHAMVASLFVRRFRPAAKPPAPTPN